MRWLIVLALAGCYSPRGTRCEPCSGIAECPGGLSCLSGTCQEALGACEARDDSGTEAMPPGEAPACLGVMMPPFIEICTTKITPGQHTLPTTINTNVGSPDCSDDAEQGGGAESICVIAADRITVTGTTRIEGLRPVALYAREGVTITGTLDLAGHAADAVGRPPVANANKCAEAPGESDVSPGSTGAGGAGATFRARGGSGGTGVGTTGAVSSQLVADGTRLRGGCRGADGGKGESNNTAGLGGNGGGAIYILAPLVQVTGTINASGGGARTGAVTGGGGGGGSGGMILLWAPDKDSLILGGAAKIFALGGGGGAGGSSLQQAGIANPGDDPDGPMSSATISSPNGNGANGGRGGNATTFLGFDGGNQGAGGAGGGGGGSTGFIMTIPMASNPDVFGPAPSSPD